MTVIGEAVLLVRPDSSGFGGELEGKLRGIFSSVPVVGAVAALGVTVGATLLHIGDEFEHLRNTIIDKTGASGQALKGLEESAKHVFSSTIGATFQNVGDAISEISVRTGLTGKALEDFTSKEIELGKITKTDVAANVQTTTALFNQYGIAASKQSGELDVLFKASQRSGVSISDLNAAMKTAAPTAQILGLNFNQTAALTANLTAAGLPASKVLMGLSSEFQKAAKAGKDPIQVIAQMEAQLKAAPNATAAAEIAMKTFGVGARQAATLVDAVRSGTLNLNDTMRAISGPGGGIDATAKATATIGDKLKLFKNQAETALAPLASKFLDLATSLIDKVGPAVEFVSRKIGDIVSAFKDGFQTLDTGAASGFIGVVLDIGAAVRSLIEGLEGHDVSGKVAGWVRAFDEVGKTLRPIIQFIEANAKPILISLGVAIALLISPIGTVVAALIAAYVHFQAFRDVVNTVAEFVTGKVIPAFRSFFTWLAGALAPLVTAFTSRWGEIKTIVIGVVTAIAAVIYVVFKAVQEFWSVFHATILRVLMAVWNQIKLEVTTAINVISDIIKLVLDLLTGHWSKAWHDLLNILKNVWDAIGGTISNALSIIGNLLAALGGIIERAAVKGAELLGSFLLGMIAKLPDLLVWIAELPLKLLEGLGDLLATLISKGIDLLAGFLAGIVKKLPDIAAWFALLPIKILGFLIGVDIWLVVKGVDLLTGFLGGLIKKLPDVLNWILALPGKLLDALVTLATLEIRGVEALVGFLGGLISKVPEVISWIASLPGKLLDALVTLGTLEIRGIEALAGFLDGVINKAGDLYGWFRGLPGRILGWLGDAASWLWNVGQQMIQGLINGITSMAGNLVNQVMKTVTSPIDAVKNFLGIGSPSKLFHGFGVNLMEGFANGIRGSSDLPAKALAALNLVASLPQLSGASGGSNSPFAAAGLGGFGGAGGGPPVNIHVHPSPGMSETMVGRVAASEVAWQMRPTQPGGR